MATERENECPQPTLPDDLIYEILSALPVKTLLRFKSVCKSWLSLISSSSFTKAHLSKSSNDPYYTNHGLILCDWNKCHCVGVYMDPRTYSLYSLLENSKTGVVNIVDDATDESKNGVVGEILDESEDYSLYSLFDESKTDEFEDYSLYSLFDESKTGVVGEILNESEDYFLHSLFDESNNGVVGEILDECEDDFLYSLFDESKTGVVHGILVESEDDTLYSLFDESKTGVVGEILDESEDDSFYSLFDESNTGVVGEILDESEDECDDDFLYSLFDESNTGVVGEILDEFEEECKDDSLFDESSTDESKDDEDDFFYCMRWRIVDGDKLISRFDTSTQGDIQIKFVVGYCNGLVCLACEKKGEQDLYDIYLWNPATRKIRKLPTLQPMDFENFLKDKCYCGFCYDELNETFKVYCVYRSYFSKYEVSVYSSKSDSWRLIGDFPFNGELYTDIELYTDTVLETPLIFANGALYWVVVDDSSDEEPRIVSLDINTDMYREITWPKYGGEEEESYIMSNLGNSLSLLCNFDSHADLWVLKKCGMEEIWTKLCTISLEDYWHIKPICILENGDIMLCNYRTILRYNSKNNTFDKLFVMDFRHYISRWCEADVCTYVESLVSP